MYLNLGNSDAIEGFRDPTSDDPDLVRYKPADGERITALVFPEGMTVGEAFNTTLAVLPMHMAEGAVPDWIDSDYEGLTALLTEHFGLSKASTSRPKTYGKATGADKFAEQFSAPKEM